MDAEQVLAFRLARSGLTERAAGTLAEAAACPASDFQHDAALMALAARADGVTRDGYFAAIGNGELVLAHIMRGAIHALAPDDLALYGRALLARTDEELGPQLGRTMQKLCEEHGIAPTDALDEVAEATTAALQGASLDKIELHEALRQRVREELLPWCKGCKSHHVSPLLWRYATVKAGVVFDGERRLVLGTPGRTPAARTAVERFLHYYAPATPGEFAEWAGVSKPHGKRLWDEVEVAELKVGSKQAWALPGDVEALQSPPSAAGVRFLPPGDPYLQRINRPLLAADDDLRKQLFRPVASPGVVLRDGQLAGSWKAKAKGKKVQITVQPIGRAVAKAKLEDEAQRIADLRGLELVLA